MSLLTDELRALIGQVRVYQAPEELGRAAIRYFATAIGDHNPLYTDEAYARQWGYDGVIAPPTLLCETNQYAAVDPDEDGYAGHSWHLNVPGTRLVRGGNRYEFHRPVRPTDIITARWVLADMTERTTQDGRHMLIVTSTAEYHDAGGAVLATNEETLIYVGRN